MKPILSHQSGYTLIELIVVIGIVVILLITSASLFYTTLIGSGKTDSAEAVKQAGQYALGQMTYLLNNSVKLVPNSDGQVCEGTDPSVPDSVGMSSIGVQNQDLGITTLDAQLISGMHRIASNSAFLTPSTMDVVAGPTFDCHQADSSSPPTVQITFTLQKGVAGVDKPRDIVTIPFTTQVELRND